MSDARIHTDPDDELVLIKTYDNSIQAHMDKNLLENEGIDSYIFDENTVSLNPLWNLTVGGIKLKTRRGEAEQAINILQQAQNATPPENELPVVCPNCGSNNITSHLHSARGWKAVLAFIVALFTLTYPVYMKEVNLCNQCGREF